MVSMYGSGERPVEDLTTRARIIDAALAQFAARGIAKATMRGIAEAAGISVGSVQHYFGTKDGLREACDERVFSLVRAQLAELGGKDEVGRLADAGFVGGLQGRAASVFPYIAQAALERDARAASMFDELASSAVRALSLSAPERFSEGDDRTRDAAAVLVAMMLGRTVLHHQIARSMGLEDDDEAMSDPRIAAAQLDAFEAMGSLGGSATGAGVRDAVDAVRRRSEPATPQSKEPTETDHNPNEAGEANE